MDESDLRWIRKEVRQRSGIVLDPGKAYLVEARLASLAGEEGLESVDSLLERLKSERANGLLQRMIHSMATSETTFFRDIHPFEALRTTLLPELIGRRLAERSLTIWSAGCASGQEIYSLALLLQEHFPGLSGWKVRLIASDLSAAMLRRAREGRYSQLEVNRGLPASYLVRYFEKIGIEWCVRPEIRRRIEFREMNLIEDWAGIPAADIVLLRNVMIYFAEETKRDIFQRLGRVLRKDGYLILGAAESTYGLSDRFERLPFDKTTIYRPSGD